jgi:glyoxylase-like metal-dependent hydrolase (beta-lactamase superfamily II)
VAAITEEVADGVWRHAGDIRHGMNVFLVAEADGKGVFAFDAGTKRMAKSVREAATKLGGLTRVILGHSHVDHRGTAPKLGVPVYCHPDEAADAEGDGGVHYQPLGEVPVFYSKWLYRIVFPIWDGGPVKITDTISEGERIGDFEVVHFPGHAPGLIGLWRESDRLCLCSDTIYLTDSMRPLGHHPGVYVPHPIFNWDSDKARESVRKLAALEPAIVCPGHLEPWRDDPTTIRGQLEYAADTTPGW